MFINVAVLLKLFENVDKRRRVWFVSDSLELKLKINVFFYVVVPNSEGNVEF
jgi:hypothetical protein